jgi:hypothetical protein
LQFSINGANLSTPFTAPAGTNVWDEFYTTWNSGASTSATICIVNQNTSTGGNDFGIDDIVFSPVCTSTESVTVTFNTNPVVSAGNYPDACVDAADITLAGTPAGGTFTGNGVTGNSFDPTIGTQTITYNYTDANGCSNSNTATITVNSLPTVSAGTYPAVCASEVSVPLSGTPAGGTFSGTGVSSNSFNPAVGTSTISYVYTDGNGCTNNANTIINVNAIPLADAGSYPAACQDAPNVNLVGSPTGGVFTGTGVLAGTFDPSVGTQTVTYTYTDGNGCVNIATALMLVNPLPNINGGTDVTVCEGETVTLNGLNGVSYSWNTGGIDGQPFTPPLGAMVYTVTGTDANGCENTAVSALSVNALPVVTAVTNNTLLCVGQTATLSVSGATTYTWSTTDNTAAVAVSPTVQTTYTVNGTDANGCSNTTTVTQDVSLCTGIVTLTNSNSSINLYPNPNNGLFTIELTSTSKVIVTNALGQIVIAETFEAGKHSLDIHNEATGVYFVKVIENNNQQIIKVVKQ